MSPSADMSASPPGKVPENVSKSRRFRGVIGYVLLVLLCLGLSTNVYAAGTTQTITVKSRLVVWARASSLSQVLAVLGRGRRVTIDGRSASGVWLHGVTDRGTRGWFPSMGLLQLHPEVRLNLLPVLATGISAPVMSTPIPRRGGY